MKTNSTLQRETYDSCAADMEPLLQQHWAEVCWRPDKFKLSPDHAKYKKLEALDVLRVYTAREDGIIVAYAVFMVTTHLHYKEVLTASNDIFFVSPDRRGLWLGVQLLKFARDALMAEGVKCWTLRMKKELSWEAIAKRVGLEEVDRVFLGWLGD